MFLLAVVLLVVAPLVELYVIIQVAHVLGGWNTLALLLVMGFVGAWLLKHQGLSVLRRITAAVQAGRVPGKELVDGMLILVAGALMLAPGFIGDVLGFLLLIPPIRAVVRAPILKRFSAGRAGVFGAVTPGGRFVGAFRVGRADVFDVSGTDVARGADPEGERRRLEP